MEGHPRRGQQDCLPRSWMILLGSSHEQQLAGNERQPDVYRFSGRRLGIFCKQSPACGTNTTGTIVCVTEQGPIVLEEDPKAIFTKWLTEHSSSVIKVSRAYTLTNDESQDLAQEILLQAWRTLPRFEGKANPATWFYRVALHTAMNWHRKDRPRRRHQKPLLEVQARGVESADSPEQIEQRELVERLYHTIHQLPKTDVALVLLYLDEMSYREMASVLGISESNVGVRLSRAKKALATLLNVAPAEGESDESR